MKNFKKALHIFKKNKIKPKWIHLAVSGGIINSKVRKIIAQEVLIYSNNPSDRNSIVNTARICQKIPYEILVNLASSTKRVVV